MTFDNSRRIVSLRLALFIATFPFLAFLAVTYVARLVKFPLLGLSETIWVVALSGTYFLIALYPSLMKYNYIYFSDDGSSVIFRFYSAGIIKGTRHAVEIPKRSFAGFSKGKKRAGLIPYIILYENRQGTEAKYPPILLTGLSRREREKVYSALSGFGPAR